MYLLSDEHVRQMAYEDLKGLAADYEAKTGRTPDLAWYYYYSGMVYRYWGIID